MKIKTIDHIVLTVADISATVNFYCDILGMQKEHFGQGRIALKFGNQKINLHQKGQEFEPKADKPTCGSADLCFIVETKLTEIATELEVKNCKIIDSIVERTGANGKIQSIYLRDPDNNLIELSNYII
jgi:catechol 2,3-dioxygenase-like lactoylglutathione lyase family enzyme